MAPVILQPVYAAALEARKNAPPVSSIPIDLVRKGADERFQSLTVPEVIEEDRTVESEGHTLRLTLFRPLGTEKDVLPVVVYYHGGGWVMGSKYVYGKLIRDICIKAHVAIVFLDYSLAPEVKYPVIHEEAYAALAWVVQNGASIPVDTDRLAVVGDSAGGNLSGAVSLMAKERGLGQHAIKAQILIYPATAESRDPYPSYHQFGSSYYPLPLEDMDFFSAAYVDPEAVAKGVDEKYLKLMLVSVQDLVGLPPALILTAEADILRDEGEAYSRKLMEAGVKVTISRMIGTMHGYMSVPVETPVYRMSLDMIKAQLEEVFGQAQ